MQWILIFSHISYRDFCDAASAPIVASSLESSAVAPFCSLIRLDEDPFGPRAMYEKLSSGQLLPISLYYSIVYTSSIIVIRQNRRHNAVGFKSVRFRSSSLYSVYCSLVYLLNLSTVRVGLWRHEIRQIWALISARLKLHSFASFEVLDVNLSKCLGEEGAGQGGIRFLP